MCFLVCLILNLVVGKRFLKKNFRLILLKIIFLHVLIFLDVLLVNLAIFYKMENNFYGNQDINKVKIDVNPVLLLIINKFL